MAFLYLHIVWNWRKNSISVLDATAMLLATSLVCLDLAAVRAVTTTVMPTLLIRTGNITGTKSIALILEVFGFYKMQAPHLNYITL